MCSGSTRGRIRRALALTVLAGLAASRSTAWSVDDKKGAEQPNSAAEDAVYELGGDVKPPKLVHYVEPAFSSSSKEAFVEGTVKISTIVATNGKPTEGRVLKGLNSDEDRTAMEAVMQWRFEPGTKGGKPVRVHVTVEVDFHLM